MFQRAIHDADAHDAPRTTDTGSLGGLFVAPAFPAGEHFPLRLESRSYDIVSALVNGYQNCLTTLRRRDRKSRFTTAERRTTFLNADPNAQVLKLQCLIELLGNGPKSRRGSAITRECGRPSPLARNNPEAFLNFYTKRSMLN